MENDFLRREIEECKKTCNDWVLENSKLCKRTHKLLTRLKDKYNIYADEEVNALIEHCHLR